MEFTAAKLRELLNYDPATGVLLWRINIGRRVKAGTRAGTINKDGHRRVEIAGKKYYAHRLAWLWMTGAWPTALMDHKNTIGDDNRWENLREATPAINSQNLRKHRGNKTGFLGVKKDGNKFQANIQLGGKQTYLGMFDTPDAAHEAYVKAKRVLHEGSTL